MAENVPGLKNQRCEYSDSGSMSPEQEKYKLNSHLDHFGVSSEHQNK